PGAGALPRPAAPTAAAAPRSRRPGSARTRPAAPPSGRRTPPRPVRPARPRRRPGRSCRAPRRQALQVLDDLLLAEHAEVDHLAGLGHVVGQLLVATAGGLLQRRLDLLHALHQQGIALGEGLDRGTEGLGQAGDLGGTGGHLGAGFLQLLAAALYLLLEAGAGAFE